MPMGFFIQTHKKGRYDFCRVIAENKSQKQLNACLRRSYYKQSNIQYEKPLKRQYAT